MSSGFKLRTLEDLGKEQYSKTAKSENGSLLFFSNGSLLLMEKMSLYQVGEGGLI